jgi:hypothetical protein
MTFVGLAIALVGSEAFSQLKGLLRKVEARRSREALVLRL